MITNIRRDVRSLLRAAPNEVILDKIKEVETALDQTEATNTNQESWNVSSISDKLDVYVDLLCESIKIKSVELSLLALRYLKDYVESEAVNAKSFLLITETVTKIEFTSTDSDLVEDGYQQAVRVCRSMVKCRASDHLTNGSISEIVIFCFRVFNSKLVRWLRLKAARTLVSITKLLFRRLKDFPDDPSLKPSYQIRLRLGGAASQSTFKELADQFSGAENCSTTTASTSSSLRIINERYHYYNLAFINDFFCYLASIINPTHEAEPAKLLEDRVILGLELIRAAFSEGHHEIGKKSCLLYTTRNNICYNIYSILKVSRSSLIISNALGLAVDIFISLRHHLKYQFEAFLERLMDLLAAGTDQTKDQNQSSTSNTNLIELRADVLNAILELFKNIPHLPHELYYNFDCDPYSSNIYENLVQICSKNCFAQHSIESHFTPIQLVSFKCLLANLADIHQVENGLESNFILSSDIGFQDGDNYSTGKLKFSTSKLRSRFPQTYKDLHSAKKRKRLLWQALEKFNARPKDGIQFIKDKNLIDNNEDLVEFLKDNLRVDKKVLGEFLSKEENKPLRGAFITSLDFTNLRIDEALRSMLEKFRLPGESQLIERILDTFSNHWFEQNKGILQNSDNALSLAYAIIMLNVDQHSKKVKPMTCDEFDRNLLSPKSERIYDRQLLDQIYTNIRDNEIILPDEQVGVVRRRYLWKCIMIKSERIDALYWTTGQLKLEKKDPIEEMNLTEGAIIEHNNNIDPLPLVNTVQKEQTIIQQGETVTKLPDATILVIGEPCDFYCSQSKESTITEDEGKSGDRLTLVETNKILFEIMWSPTIAALSFVLDKIDTTIYIDLSKRIVDQGFIKIAHLCAKHGHLDNLVVSLCKFTSDLNPIPHNHSGQKHIMSEKNSLAALSLLSIIRDYANCIRDSWSNIIRNILQWYCSRCIDDVVQVDDFALQQKYSLRMREVKKYPSTMNQQSSTFLRSVYTYFAGQQPSNESGNGKNGTTIGINSSTESPHSAIGILLQTIQDAEYSQDSLCELITALATSGIDGDPEEIEDAEVFKLEIFTQIILNNKEQAGRVWPKIRGYFVTLAPICGNRSQWLGERIVSSAFRVAIQFRPKPEVLSLLGHLIATLDPEIIRGNHTFVALTTLSELHSTSETCSMDSRELEACFHQVIFPFLDKVLDGCDPIHSNRILNRAINLLSKIFLKHHKLLKELPTFAALWYAILDIMEKYIKTNGALKEATFELVKNMVLVMDNEQCMSVEMKDFTRTKFMFWEFQSGSDY